MTRLIDPSLEKLSAIMNEMGNTAIDCISLAIDSYFEGKNTTDEVHTLSDSISTKYFEVEDLIFDMLLKYQPVADDFRLIRYQLRYLMLFQDLVDMLMILHKLENCLEIFLNVIMNH